MSFRAFKIYVKRRVGHQENEGYHSSISLNFLANFRIPNHVFQLCVAYALPWTSSSGSSTTRNLRASPNWYLKPRRPSAVQGLKSCQWSCFFLRVHFFAIYFFVDDVRRCRVSSTQEIKHQIAAAGWAVLSQTSCESGRHPERYHTRMQSAINQFS